MSRRSTKRSTVVATLIIAVAGCSAQNSDVAAQICASEYRSELIGPQLATAEGAERWVDLYNSSQEILSASSSSPEEKAIAEIAKDWFFVYGYDIESGRSWGSMSEEWADLGVELGAACDRLG